MDALFFLFISKGEAEESAPAGLAVYGIVSLLAAAEPIPHLRAENMAIPNAVLRFGSG
jgi:hypothetical protein